MGKTFDELFNDFFKKDDEKPKEKPFDKLEEFLNNLGFSKRDEVTNKDEINNILSKFTDLTHIPDDVEKMLDGSLGEPDSVEFFNDGHLSFEKKIWHTEKGDLIKVNVVEIEDIEPVNEKSLDEQLEEAIEKEDYEKAAAIRDSIKKNKKKKK